MPSKKTSGTEKSASKSLPKTLKYGTNAYRNAKSKRTRNLVKKCQELESLCTLKVKLLIYNPRQNELQKYQNPKDFSFIDLEELLKITTTGTETLNAANGTTKTCKVDEKSKD